MTDKLKFLTDGIKAHADRAAKVMKVPTWNRRTEPAGSAEPTVTVRYDLSTAETESVIRGKLIALGWTPPQAAGSAGKVDEREAFEAWVRQYRPTAPLDRHPEDPSRYDGVLAEWTWASWQARAALQAQTQISDEEIMELFDKVNRCRLTNARSPWLESVLIDFARALLTKQEKGGA